MFGASFACVGLHVAVQGEGAEAAPDDPPSPSSSQATLDASKVGIQCGAWCGAGLVGPLSVDGLAHPPDNVRVPRR